MSLQTQRSCRWLALALITVWPALGWGEESASFLKLGVGARAAGLGGAYTSIASGLEAAAWNPAGLAATSKKELGAMHSELAAGTRYNFLGYAQPTRHGALAAYIVHLNQGALGGRDSEGRLNGGFTAAESAFAFGYGRNVGSTSIGASAKIVHSRISGDSGQTVAFDLGAARSIGNIGPGKTGLGLTVQNLGPGLRLLDRSSPLPLTLSMGADYGLPFGLTMAADVRHRTYSRGAELSLGTEFRVISGLALRAGYASSHAPLSGSAKISDLSGFAAGIGLKVLSYSIDYSMTPYGGLGNAHRVYLGAKF